MWQTCTHKKNEKSTNYVCIGILNNGGQKILISFLLCVSLQYSHFKIFVFLIFIDCIYLHRFALKNIIFFKTSQNKRRCLNEASNCMYACTSQEPCFSEASSGLISLIWLLYAHNYMACSRWRKRSEGGRGGKMPPTALALKAAFSVQKSNLKGGIFGSKKQP